MSNAVIVDTTSLCQSFPLLDGEVLDRKSILQTIDITLRAGASAVAIDGPTGAGKTTVLALFAKSRSARCVSVFLRPSTRWGLDPSLITHDLAGQVEWLLSGEVKSVESVLTNSDLQKLFYSLGRRLGAKREICTVVVDGLLDEAIEKPQLTGVLDLLPLGNPNYRFVFSGDPSDLRLPSAVVPKVLLLPMFTVEEAAKFFGSVEPNIEVIKEIHSTCQGVPGYLASVKRLFESGMTIDDFRREAPKDLTRFFDLEWKKVGTTSPWQRQLLSVIAFDNRRHFTTDLSAILSVDSAEIKAFCSDFKLLELTPDLEVRFVTEILRKVAERDLKDTRLDTLRLVVKHLEENPTSRDRALYLPGYYRALNQLDDVITVLSPSFFHDSLRTTESLAVLRRHAEMGIQAAQDAGRFEEAIRFRLHRAALSDASAAGADQREVVARASLNQSTKALALARSATLRERRFQGLALAAGVLAKDGARPDPDLILELRQLYEGLDVEALGDEGLDVAASLIDVVPDLALSIVERVTQRQTDPESNNIALLRMSIVAELAVDRGEQRAGALEQIRQRITDPKMRGFARVGALVTRRSSAIEAITQAETLDSAEERLSFARLWLSANKAAADAAEVGLYAIREALKASEISLTADVLSECAAPLRFVGDPATAAELTRVIDSHLSSAVKLGPTEDAVRLQLTLAIAIGRTDLDTAETRLHQAFGLVDGLVDPAQKAAGLALILAALPEISARATEEEAQKGILVAQVRESVAEVLRVAAEQAEALDGALCALALSNSDLAVEFALSLNTQKRRDEALLAIADTQESAPIAEIRPHQFLEVVSQISDEHLRNRAIGDFCNRLGRIRGLDSAEQRQAMTAAARAVASAPDVTSATIRTEALANLLSVFVRYGDENDARHCEERLRKAFAAVDDSPAKTRVCFLITRILSECRLDLANEFLEEAARSQANTAGVSPSLAIAMTGVANLAVRASAGLMTSENWSSTSLERLLALVDGVASTTARCSILSSIAIHANFAGRGDDVKTLVSQRLRPMLEKASAEDIELRDNLIQFAAPALFFAHRADAFRWCLKADPVRREWAFEDIARTILRKVPPDEPYDKRIRRGFRLSYEDALDVIEVMKLMTHDGALFELVKDLVESVLDDVNKYDLTGDHKKQIAADLKQIVLAKFPSPSGIQHEGYRLVAEAQLLRLERAPRQAFNDLRTRALAIPNLSDRAFILAILAACVPHREEATQRGLVLEAEGLLDRLHVGLERLERCHDLASEFKDVDTLAAKRLLQRGTRMGLKDRALADDVDAQRVQRAMVDLAFQIDPDFARSLAASADDDPARGAARTALRDRLALLEAKKKVTQGEDMPAPSSLDIERQTTIAFELLGGLNSGAVLAKRFQELGSIVDSATRVPLADGYWLWAWVIQNLVSRYSRTPDVSRFLQPCLDACLLTGELLREIDGSAGAWRSHLVGELGRTFVVKRGERSQAIAFLCKWLESHQPEEITICDPYFGVGELGLIQQFQSAVPAARFSILTSRKHNMSLGLGWAEQYRDYWRNRVSIEPPPSVDIVIAGYEHSGKGLIHDRYVLGSDAGLRLGTSFNGLGGDQDSSLSELTLDDCATARIRVQELLSRSIKHSGGQRILYDSFTL